MPAHANDANYKYNYKYNHSDIHSDIHSAKQRQNKNHLSNPTTGDFRRRRLWKLWKTPEIPGGQRLLREGRRQVPLGYHVASLLAMTVYGG